MHEPTETTSVVGWIEATCAQYPDHVAVTGIAYTPTCGELWNRASQLARELREMGVRAESLVGIWAEQSSDLLVGIVGILAAGGAYVPLDPSYPESRLAHVASDAGLELIVAPARHAAEAAHLGAVRVVTTPASSDPAAAPVPLDVAERDAAYVIYTSGSTGTPKGVVVEHRSLLHLLRWMVAAFDPHPGERMLGTASPAFDASVPNLFVPLVTAGTYVALDVATTWDPYALAGAIERFGPRTLQTSPTMLRMLCETDWKGDPDLEVWVGGERTAPSVIRYIVPRVRALYNFYGPTEATVSATFARLFEADADSPVGHAPEHIRLLLLDHAGEPAPAGEPGELYLAGASLARGYQNDPALTAERFTDVALGGGAAVRAYRTGDLARFRPDGSLVILGRVDNQMKLRGYRIEPLEIEQRLAEHGGVVDAAVVLHTTGETDEPRLVALVKLRGEVPARELRAFVRETLPDHMVPAAVVELDEFPLTPSGKVDRRELVAVAAERLRHSPAPASDATEAEAPSDLERAMLSMYARVLSLRGDAVGLDDDFFDLGGTSLRCARLFMAIDETLGVALPLSSLVAAPTPRLLADVVSSHLVPGGSRGVKGEAPRHEWERILSLLWSEVLEVPDVRRTDNFFELGGTPADATRMLGRLRALYGAEVTLVELAGAPPVEQLAVLVGSRTSRSSLVPLNTTGSKPPFFCIAGAGGLAVTFLPLARLLGADQPVCGLAPRGIESRARPDYTLRETASRYARAIREVQPRGPYLLGGHSLGGVLALDVAHLLEIGRAH